MNRKRRKRELRQPQPFLLLILSQGLTVEASLKLKSSSLSFSSEGLSVCTTMPSVLNHFNKKYNLVFLGKPFLDVYTFIK